MAASKNLNENPFPEIVELEVTDTLDLHTFSPRDVGDVVCNYLKEARKRGFKVIRIIHGKGIGVQREKVRSILGQTDFVESFSDAESWGATVARLK